ncbi:PorP/SprF family type IX secretion system membrane protein [Aridibaculum aurantiacum]|uniref:PorP/SprF family type IX secretion system membrane protein n=1 Tax=Aridibaculum aurantiacum TaxID=2810307 RepID=UPI001A974A8A|nr:PorP/SprF family type IX secretion system membrane protein [Aridibaculum aurantiacum]
MKKYFTLALVVVSLCTANAQDYNFSQFYELPLLRNPALAGIFDGNFRAKSVFRNQWQSVTTPYRTSGISAEMKFHAGRGNWHNLAMQATYDVAGDSRLSRVQVLPVYTFHLQIAEENYLSMGMMAGAVSSQFDPTKLTWDDQFVNGSFNVNNPTSQIIRNTNRNYFELATGLAFTRPLGEMGTLYIGGSMFHITRPRVSFDPNNEDRLERKYGLNGGLTVPTGARDAFTFYTDAFFQGGHRQNMIGGMYTMALADEYYDDKNKTSLHVGGAYRWNDAFIPVIKLDYQNFSFGLSYDVNTSKLKTASQSRGGFEFTLTYRNNAIGAGHNGDVPCPRFGSNF